MLELMEKHEFIKLPVTDIRGVLMRKDSPLAAVPHSKPDQFPYTGSPAT